MHIYQPLAGHAPRENPIPYSREALRQDLDRLRSAWRVSHSSRERDAIYHYLSAVYELVSWWAAERQENERVRRSLFLSRMNLFAREDPFAAVIRCTADPQKVEKRTRSKWSRMMRYVVRHKPRSQSLTAFVKREGGINECAGRFHDDGPHPKGRSGEFMPMARGDCSACIRN